MINTPELSTDRGLASAPSCSTSVSGSSAPAFKSSAPVIHRGVLSFTTAALLPIGLLVFTPGCAHPRGRPVEAAPAAPPLVAPAGGQTGVNGGQTGTTRGPAGETGERIKADPIAFVREVLAKADAPQQYSLTFYRQERLGGKLREEEQIRALFRKQPFSVKFVWENPDAAYYEMVYVAGQNDNKLVVRERKGALPLLPPTTRRVEPMEAVKFGRTLNPITDFGLANLARRTLAPMEDPAIRPELTIHYRGVVNLDPQSRPAYDLRIEHPPMPGLQYTAQDFYVDTATGLPAGTDLYLPGGELGARYRYVNVNPNVQLTDADFRLGGG
jgi:hypothetical protein